MTMCRMQSIEANQEIEKNDANIVKNEVRKTRFFTKKSKNLKIKISKNFFKVKCYRCHKNEHYVRNCVEFELIKKSSKTK